MSRPPASSAGFGLAELLVATAIGLVAATAVALELRALLRAAQVQDEAVDVVQRARAVAGSVADAIGQAGSGFSVAAPAGWVAAAAPRIVPARFAVRTTDPSPSAFTDRFAVLAARRTPRSSTLAAPMGAGDAVLTIAPLPGCRPASPTCDLAVGDLALVADRRGHADLLAVTAISGNLVAHEPVTLTHAYDPVDDVRVIPVEARALMYDAATAQLREYRGRSQAMVVADDIVGFDVRYFGAPDPPSGREFLPGEETCVASAEGETRLPGLDAGGSGLVELAPERLRDGPFCGVSPYRFDADVLRVRLVRVVLRVQASDPAVRGRAPVLFTRPGWSVDPDAEVPDREVTIDVAVPNALTVG